MPFKTEKEVIGQIGQVLRNLGENRQSVNYFLNVDEDFISDVLGCYNYKGKEMEIQIMPQKCERYAGYCSS